MAILCDGCGGDIWTANNSDGLEDYFPNQIEVTDRNNVPNQEIYHLCDSCLDTFRESMTYALSGNG